MNVFVIIVTYNGLKWYDNCLQSLKSSKITLNTVVVDNASSDDTINYITKAYPEVIIIKNSKNLGFGRGNNIGIKYALDHKADYVFLLNQDAWINKDTVDKLIKIHKSNTQFGVLSPVHVNPDRTGIEKLLLNRLFDFRTTDSTFFNDMYFNKLKDVYETKYVNAAAWFIPVETIKTVGGFDPFFTHYGEDDNYLNRIFYHGYKVGICPKLSIVHDADRPRKLYEENEEEILWRIEYTNINSNYQLFKEQIKSLKKTVTNFIKLRISRSKFWWRKFNFIRENRASINYSIKMNRQTGKTWLE